MTSIPSAIPAADEPLHFLIRNGTDVDKARARTALAERYPNAEFHVKWGPEPDRIVARDLLGHNTKPLGHSPISIQAGVKHAASAPPAEAKPASSPKIG